MLVIIALIIGSSTGGIVGMLASGSPIAALLKIQFERLVDYLMKKRGIRSRKRHPGRRARKSAASASEAPC